MEDVDSGCIYGHYSIPLAIIAAKHEKLEAASDDGKQPEDSKPYLLRYCYPIANSRGRREKS